MKDFLLPPKIDNNNNNMRKVGFELEFSNLKIEDIVNILVTLYKGEFKKVNPFYYKVNTRYGEFNVGLDFELLAKDKFKDSINELLNYIGVELDSTTIKLLEDKLAKVSKTVVPYEISTPPLELMDLSIIEIIKDELKKVGAYGTKNRFYYAFGLHINPELPSFNVKIIGAYLKAFFILYEYLNEDIDLSRKVTPHINMFSREYIKVVLSKNYNSIDEMIEEYLKYNPTRNRVLDMLPLFCFIDETKVREKLPNEKINKRPTFHYRLPNSDIDNNEWSIASEWNKWVEVEKLAFNEDLLQELSDRYLKYLNNIFDFSWREELFKWIK